MITLNCLGDICPIPILKIKAQLKSMHHGDSLLTITDHSCVATSILDHYKNKKYDIKSEEVMNGVWEITLTLL